jgi:hypothetical protein
MALIANLSHYLGDDLSLIKIPAPAAAIREFLGCIAEAVTSRDPDDENYVTPLKCRLHCNSDIIAFFDQDNPSIIKWSCMFCKDEGQLTGWERTTGTKGSVSKHTAV